MATQPTETDKVTFEDLVTYELEKLLNLWHRGDLTTEQMVGHLFQHLAKHEKRITAMEQGRFAPSTGGK
jgi:hypothetical protein